MGDDSEMTCCWGCQVPFGQGRTHHFRCWAHPEIVRFHQWMWLAAFLAALVTGGH